MTERAIGDLRNAHEGHDIYIVASGPTAGFIDPAFFDNKIAIGVNEVWHTFRNLDYLVRKEARNSQAAYASGVPMIVSRHNCGNTSYALNRFEGERDYYVFDHLDNGLQDIDLSIISLTGDLIVVSYSTITSAIHIAAVMGAANIILVGADCGTLDGKVNITGYPPSILGDEFYRTFITQIEPQTAAVRDRIKEVYGCNLYSLNPFLNLGLEGHKYER